MAFAIRNLSVQSYSNGFTLWHYAGRPETRDQIAAPNYFEGAADMFSRGDMVLVSASDGGAMLYVTQTDVGNVRVETMVATASASAREAA